MITRNRLRIAALLLVALAFPALAKDDAKAVEAKKKALLQAAFQVATAPRPVDLTKLAPPMRHSQDTALGNIEFRAGRFDEAIAQYRKALVRNDKEIYTRYLLGCVLLETGRHEDARKAFAEVYKQMPTSPSALAMERLCGVLIKQKDAPLLKTAVRLVEEARNEVRRKRGKAFGLTDPLDSLLLRESHFGVGVYVLDGTLLRKAVAGRAIAPRDVAAAVYFASSGGVRLKEALEHLNKFFETDEDLRFLRYLASRSKPAEAAKILETLRTADPANGYYCALLAAETYKTRLLSPPKGAKEKKDLTFWKAAAGKVKYRSRFQVLLNNHVSMMRRSGYPFHEFARMGLSSVSRDQAVALIARRLRREIWDAAKAGDAKRARELVEQTRKIALKVLRDEPTTAGTQLAVAIFGDALSGLPPVEPKEGEVVEENWDFETSARKFASEVRRRTGQERKDGLLIAAVSGIPVPRLQAAAIGDLRRREARIAKSVEKQIAGWTLPPIPKKKKESE